MNVGEFCGREVVIASKEATIVEVAKLMRKHHVGDVVIVEHDRSPPMPIGIITDRDIVVELVAAEVPLEAVRVGDVMSYDLVTAREDESTWDALQRMRTRGVRRLPVVNGQGGLEGILALDDLLELLSEELVAVARVPGREIIREKKLLE
jgi:CBS domain-containing protein